MEVFNKTSGVKLGYWFSLRGARCNSNRPRPGLPCKYGILATSSFVWSSVTIVHRIVLPGRKVFSVLIQVLKLPIKHPSAAQPNTAKPSLMSTFPVDNSGDFFDSVYSCFLSVDTNLFLNTFVIIKTLYKVYSYVLQMNIFYVCAKFHSNRSVVSACT